MGAHICKNKQQAWTGSRIYCSKCNVIQGGRQFTGFEGCQHLFCKNCVNDGSTVCPFQHEQKSFIKQGIEMIRDFNSRQNDFSVYCSAKHLMQWKAAPHICKKCLEESHGFRCKTCSEYICTFCVRDYSFKTKKECPNRHPCVWTSLKRLCLWCDEKKHGWSCSECNFFICTGCSETVIQKNKLLCFNDTNLKWTNTKHHCIKCNNLSHGFKCFQCCDYSICTSCSGIQFNQLLCPNQHKTTFKAQGRCVKCLMVDKVMRCEKCQFSLCTKCQLQKYVTNSVSTISTERDFVTKKAEMFTVSNALYQNHGREQPEYISQQQAIESDRTNKKETEVMKENKQVNQIKALARNTLIDHNYGMAVQNYKTLAQLQPNNIQNLLDLAEAYEMNSQYAEALITYNRINQIDSKRIEGLKKANSLILRISQKQEKLEKLKPAESQMIIRNCEKILEIEDKDIETNFLLGNLLLANRNIDKAVSYLMKAEKYQHAQLKSAKDYSNSNRYIQILNKLSIVYAEKGEQLKSLSFLDTIIQLYKQYEICYKFTVGYWLMQKGDKEYILKRIDAAKSSYSEVDASDPNFLEASLKLSKL